jgi:hypothetical protein
MLQTMKVKNIILGMLSFSLIALSSCEKSFDQLEKDSNRAVQVPASLVLQAIEFNVMNDNGRPFSAEARYNQFYCSNYNYYANNEYNLGQMPNQYTTLKNVVKMEEEAKKLGFKDRSLMGYALRTQQYRFIIWMNKFTSKESFDASKVYAKELYDYKNDPLEKVSVIGNKDYEAVEKEMYGKMLDFFKAQAKK